MCEQRQKPGGPKGADAALLHLADTLAALSNLQGSSTYVMPDLLTFLAQGSQQPLAEKEQLASNRQVVEEVLLLSCSTSSTADLLTSTRVAVDGLDQLLNR